MSSPLSLFDLPPTAPYQPGSVTSRDAARDIYAELPRITAIIMADVIAAGAQGRTYRETMAATGFCSGTVTGRFNDLKKQGLIVATARRRGKPGVVVGKQFYGKDQAAA
jgi:hypothetical protein